MIEKVWNGRIVSETAIGSRISAALAAIGGSGRAQHCIKTGPRKGCRFIASVHFDDPVEKPQIEVRQTLSDSQKVYYCQSRDGTDIAYSRTGRGYPMVRVGHWLTHLEYDWRSPIWRPFQEALGQSFSLHRYDQRGSGLSARDVTELSLARFTEELEAVVAATGLERLPLTVTGRACCNQLCRTKARSSEPSDLARGI